jgi:hypothetical protein
MDGERFLTLPSKCNILDLFLRLNLQVPLGLWEVDARLVRMQVESPLAVGVVVPVVVVPVVVVVVAVAVVVVVLVLLAVVVHRGIHLRRRVRMTLLRYWGVVLLYSTDERDDSERDLEIHRKSRYYFPALLLVVVAPDDLDSAAESCCCSVRVVPVCLLVYARGGQ